MAFDVSANGVVSVSPQGGNAPSVSTGESRTLPKEGKSAFGRFIIISSVGIVKYN